MIEITRVEEKYLEGLKKMMLQECLNYDELSLCFDTLYIVADRLEVLGFGYYNIYGNDIYLDHLYIKANERLNKLGDSLFRTILNSLLMQGVETVFMRADTHYDGFLRAENIERKEDKFVIRLNEFFSRKCRGSQKKMLLN